MLNESVEHKSSIIIDSTEMDAIQKRHTAELIYLASVDFYKLFPLDYEKIIHIIVDLLSVRDSDLAATVGLCSHGEIVGVHAGFPIQQLYDRQMISVLTILNEISYEEKRVILQSLQEYSKQIPKIQQESYYVARFAVRESCRGSNVATLLFKDFIKNTMGYSDISLHVKTDNFRAISFYQKQQFKFWQNPEFLYATMLRQNC